MSNFQKIVSGALRGNTVLGTDIGSGAATSAQFLAANGSGGSAFRVLASSDLPTITLTGDVTGAASAGSISTTIAANIVSNAKFRQSSGLSVVGNSTSSTANVADITGTANQVLVVNSGGTSLGFGAVNLASGSAVTGTLANGNTTATSANTASTIVARDTNKNFQTNMVEQGVTTTATAAGTTTLTVSSTPIQQFTGATTQNLVLPDATTLNTGHWYNVLNTSSGAVTVKNNGASTLATVGANSKLEFYLINNGTANGTWDFTSTYGTGSGLSALGIRSGSQSISSGATTVTVTYSSSLGTTSYSLVCSILNITDTNPQFQAPTITSFSATGFTATLDGAAATANYVLHYQAIVNV